MISLIFKVTDLSTDLTDLSVLVMKHRNSSQNFSQKLKNDYLTKNIELGATWYKEHFYIFSDTSTSTKRLD